MDYCGPRGIPHSHFLGGLNEWTPDDYQKALAWQLHEQRRCSSCGTHPDEWDPEQGGDPHAYEAGLTHCRGCEVNAKATDLHTEHTKQKGSRRGYRPALKPTTP